MVGDEITIDGTALCEMYGLVIKHFEDEPPEPKTEIIEIPFGEDVDITDSFGEVNFSPYKMTVDFLALCGGEKFRELISTIKALLHGKRTTFELSVDPGYTYQGRFQMKDLNYSSSSFGEFSLEIDVDPWKIKPDREYTFNAYPAVTKVFESGRKTVRPEVTSTTEVRVMFNGVEEKFPSGTHSSANLAFTWGQNSINFRTPDWVFYQRGNVLVVNDKYISYDESTETITLADEIISAFRSPMLILDDLRQFVTVKYTWKDI